ncbi:MAG: bifunctional UDP-N-acetylglucosamine diphosphorylase/glucosamine-1-phosphate N-acetyltransferase GlmU [Pyramidobacter sp.]|nr:bifunctional UDP-N-acetylglucosamine diphosphorylase/glucosamine-1-phosphate N-acetyltransferase GlmU [Pyramidobacter sp.]
MAQPFNCSALILAAGKGSRMKSSLPKVMQPLLEEPMLFYVLKALKEAGIDDIAAVIGHGGEHVEKWLSETAPDVQVVWQREQLGTGHAVMSASEWLRTRQRVLVINGDMPMITAEEISSFLELSGGADISFMTCCLSNPAQYGRVIRGASSVKIVEAKDASPEELKVSEINVGVYLFSVPQLLEGLSTLTRGNSQGEYYIVDLIAWGCQKGLSVRPAMLPADNLSGVNDPAELANLSVKMRDRILAKWLKNGVKCVDPASVWISPRAVFHGEAFLYPNVQIWGDSEIGDGCLIQSGTILRSCVLKQNVQCLGYVVAQDIVAEEGVKMGPFCFLRDGTHLLKNSFAGKFVEIKKSEVGEGSKVPHLSYIGDAAIGAGTNIGAATVTCNYDGVRKHKTHIGSGCFIGSDTMLVAPVTVGDRALIGAGSVITEDVPEESLAVARGRQVVIDGWVRKKNSGKKNSSEA